MPLTDPVALPERSIAITKSISPGVLYLIVCAAPRAKHVGKLISLAHQADWTVCVIATPQAMKFIDVESLERCTGYPILHEYKDPDEPDMLPAPDAMIVCPATFNTMNKWALGISDTLALGLITEAIGLGIPLVAAPSLTDAQAAHPAFVRSMSELRELGVTVLYGKGIYEPVPPDAPERPYDWDVPLKALQAKLPA